MKNSKMNRVGSFQNLAIEDYWNSNLARYGKSRSSQFKELCDVHLSSLSRNVKPAALQGYDQYLYQYNVGTGGSPYQSSNYLAFVAARNGEGVEFIGTSSVPVTKHISFCNYVWRLSGYNSTWTKDFEAIGSGCSGRNDSRIGRSYLSIGLCPRSDLL